MSKITSNVNFFIGFAQTDKRIKQNKFSTDKHKDERKFYSCKKDYNYVTYVDKGSKEKIDFVDYSGNKEKSLGAFNKKGLLTKDEKQILKRKLSRTKSPIWHGFVSFEELFGKEYCNDYKQAYELMKLEFPKFLKTAGFNIDNIEWFAGLHTNTDHRHIHFSFYEKKSLKILAFKEGYRFSNGKVNKFSISKFKVDVELRLRNLKRIYADRDVLVKSAKDMLVDPKLNDFIYRNIRDLSDLLPKEKRFSYSSENIKPYKKLIDDVTSKIIGTNKQLANQYEIFIKEALSKDEEIIKICKNSNLDYKMYLLSERYIGDLNRRLGNLVLSAIKEVEFKERRVIETEYRNRLVEKRIKKNKRKRLISRSNYLKKKVETEAFKYLNELTRKLDSYKFEMLRKEEEM